MINEIDYDNCGCNNTSEYIELVCAHASSLEWKAIRAGIKHVKLGPVSQLQELYYKWVISLGREDYDLYRAFTIGFLYFSYFKVEESSLLLDCED